MYGRNGDIKFGCPGIKFMLGAYTGRQPLFSNSLAWVAGFHVIRNVAVP